MSDRPDVPPDLEVDIPVPQGLRVTTDRPYHILVVSDLAGIESGAVSGPLAKGVVAVTADTFDEVMAEACPTVEFTLADPLAPGSVMVALGLRFDSVRAFDPKHLVTQIPAAQALTDVRENLVERLRGKLASDALTESVATAAAENAALAWLVDALRWTAAPLPDDPGAVDDLLGQIDLGDEPADDVPASPPKTGIGAVVAAAAGAGSTVPPEEAAAVRRAVTEIDRRVGVWLNTVLHAPQVQSVESAWRSIAFLVSHMEFRKGVRLSLLHAPQADLLERFRTRLVDPIFDEGADAPSVIAVDMQFGNTAADLEALDELAQHGASLPAVVVAGAAPGFFGTKFAWQIPTLPTIASLFDQWQFAKWKTLRGQSYARSLAVVFGRCLLRVPYGRDDTGDLAYSFREERVTDRDFIWSGGAMAVACTIARSMADTGWPTAMAGFVHGRLDGCKTAEGGKQGDKKFGPTDTQTPQPKIEEMAAVGLNAAVGVRDHDDAIVWNGLTAARARPGDVNALLEVSLPYQLFATRLSQLLFELKPALAGLAADKVTSIVTQHVRDWLDLKEEPTAEQLLVQTRSPEDDPANLELAVTVTPPAAVLPGEIPVVLGYRVN